MPACPVIDSHLHLWDPRLIRYPWLDQIPSLNRPYLLEDYHGATASLPLEAMVFVQCEADCSAFHTEANWVAQLAKTDPRIRGLVAWAPLENGAAVRKDLERLKCLSILRGIRRIIQFESDLDFCLQPTFIEGVKALADFDLSFDICIDHRHIANVIKFARQVPQVPMILDHMAKPAIKDGLIEPWARQLRELARLPHVSCKISGVATEADHKRWTGDQLKPYIEIAIEAFGIDRVMFGGDWPVSTQAIQYGQWVTLLDQLLQGVRQSDRCKFWHDNAVRTYRVPGCA